MNPRNASLLMALLMMFGSAFAAEDLDVTMRVIEDDDISEEIFVNEIALPEQASENARENAAQGRETSNQARQQGTEFGRERSQSAQENSGRPEQEPSFRPDPPVNR